MRKSFIRFLIAGAVNTVLSYLIYLLLLEFFSYSIAYSIAYLIGIVISYILNAHYVFQQSLNFKHFIQFPIVYVIQYALGITLLKLLVEAGSMEPRLGMILIILITTPVTFFLSRLLLRIKRN